MTLSRAATPAPTGEVKRETNLVLIYVNQRTIADSTGTVNTYTALRNKAAPSQGYIRQEESGALKGPLSLAAVWNNDAAVLALFDLTPAGGE